MCFCRASPRFPTCLVRTKKEQPDVNGDRDEVLMESVAGATEGGRNAITEALGGSEATVKVGSLLKVSTTNPSGEPLTEMEGAALMEQTVN